MLMIIFVYKGIVEQFKSEPYYHDYKRMFLMRCYTFYILEGTLEKLSITDDIKVKPNVGMTCWKLYLAVADPSRTLKVKYCYQGLSIPLSINICIANV